LNGFLQPFSQLTYKILFAFARIPCNLLKRNENPYLLGSERSEDLIVGGIWVIINRCPIQDSGVILHSEKVIRKIWAVWGEIGAIKQILPEMFLGSKIPGATD